VTNVANLNSVFGALIQPNKNTIHVGYYTSINGADGKPHKLDVRLAPFVWVKDATTTFSLKPAFISDDAGCVITGTTVRRYFFAAIWYGIRQKCDNPIWGPRIKYLMVVAFTFAAMAAVLAMRRRDQTLARKS